MTDCRTTFALATIAAIGASSPAKAGEDDQVTFTTVDVPGALSVVLADISSTGDMVGRYCADESCAGPLPGPDAGWRGFLLSDREATSIDFPGAIHTNATGINARGDIVGRYRDDPDGGFHGFVLRGGEFTAIDFPGAFSTRAYGITPDGDTIVGDYCTDSGCIRPASGHWHGFLLSKDEFTSIDFPDAIRTYAQRINRRGQIVGTYRSADGGSHSFRLSEGTFTSIDFPGAGNTGGDAGGINARGDIVSSYCEPIGCSVSAPGGHGFLLSRGNFISFDFPGAILTNAYAINSRGDIVGVYFDTDVKVHGFLRSRGDQGED